MIIVDRATEEKLAAKLESLKADAGTSRCIHLRLPGHSSAELINQLTAASKQYPELLNSQLFLCEDGDIFILAPYFPTKEYTRLALWLSAAFNMPASEDWIRFHEVSLDIHKLLHGVDKKIETQRLRKLEEQKKQEESLTERKRKNILNGASPDKYKDIVARRKNRQMPEIMIIEDDSFSRRLVENVIQKKYSLTGLDEATHALDTYARLAPDLLFLDIDLPDVTGHELLEKIVSIDPEAYVIMLSGNCDSKNVKQAMSIGAKGFVAKPFTREKLFDYIHRCPTIAH